MESKKKSKVFWWLLIIFFIVYASYYLALQNGYYEYKVYEDTTLTKEQIKQFESDVKDGKEIDLDNYIKEDKSIVSNGFSKAGLSFSTKVDQLVSSTVDTVIKVLSYLFKT